MILHGDDAERADLANKIEHLGLLLGDQTVPRAAGVNQPLGVAVDVQNPGVEFVLPRIGTRG